MVVVCDVFRTIVFHHVNGESWSRFKVDRSCCQGTSSKFAKTICSSCCKATNAMALVVTCRVPSPDHVAAVHAHHDAGMVHNPIHCGKVSF